MNKNRPLSPHLTIYKKQITSIMSILHRITGICLSFSLFFFTWFLLSVSSGEDAYNYFNGWVKSVCGYVIFFGIIVALFYHLFNGIRHLFWDAGYGYNIETVTKSGVIVLFLTFLSSLMVICYLICV